MKIYIVFLSLLIVHIHLMAFNQELGRYIMLQNLFKNTSEECAAQAALLLDEEELLRGNIIFLKDSMDPERAVKAACDKLGLEGGYFLTLSYEDDGAIYNINNLDKNPRVTATIEIDVSPLFKTSLFRETFITRISCYEILK